MAMHAILRNTNLSIVAILIIVGIGTCDGRKRPTVKKFGEAQPTKASEKATKCEKNSRCSRDMSATERGFNTTRNCFCDSACKIYKDCCRNYRHMKYPDKDDGMLTSGFKIPDNVLTCDWVDFLSSARVYVISKCPSDFKNATIKRKCESKEWDNDIFTKIPVTDVFSRLLFKNVFCAKCFGGVTEYSFWTYNITCRLCHYNATKVAKDASSFLQSALEVMRKNEFADGRNRLDYSISLQHPVYKHRNCKPHISECSASWGSKHDPDGIIARKCRGPTDYVYVGLRPVTVYRNIYCALCNFRNETQIDCLAPNPSIVGEENPNIGPPMSILLDLNSGSADAVVGQEGTYTVTRTVVSKMTCVKDQVYDLLAGRCRSLECADGYVIENGQCKMDGPDAILETDYNSEGVLPCARIKLDPSDFVMLKNKSILVPAYGEVYAPNQYVMDEGYASICTPFTDQNYTLIENKTYVVKMFKFDSTQSFISFIGTIVSLFSLLFHFIVYMCLPPLRNIPGKCLICLVVSLFVGQLLFLAGTPRTEIPEVCVSLGIIMHFAFLAAFCWMNVMAFDIWRTFTPDSFQSPSDERATRFTWYSIYAWFMPLLVVTVGILLQFLDPMLPIDGAYRPHYGDGLCWITRRLPLLYLFAIPVAVLILCNIVLYILTIKNLCILSENAKMVDSNNKWRFVLYIKLSFIMGLTWVFGFLAATVDIAALWYVFIVFNSLQGAFICVAFVCTKKVYRLVSEKIRPKRRQKSRINVTASRSTNYTRSTTLLYDPQAKVVSHETSI